MNRIALLILIFFTLSLLYCKGKEEKEKTLNIPPIYLGIAQDQNGFIRDIPPEDTSSDIRLMKQMAEKSLGLGSIENGYDKLEIRIWNEQEEGNRGKLFLLQNKNNEWNAVLYRYDYFFDKYFQNLDTIIGTQIELGKPNSGWNAFASQLFRLNILTLPDYSLIPMYNIGMDETGIGVEVATKNVYRSYNYPSPQARTKESTEAKNMVEIMKLIKQEFKLPDFWSL